jgi:acyl-CoA reductase-like NAD-dependent aldehyde dehydrogenase
MSTATPYADVSPHVLALAHDGQAFIDGRYVPALSGRTLDNFSPVDGSPLPSLAACDGEDVDAAVAAARVAFEDGRWSRRSPRERKRVLLAFAEAVRDHRDALAQLITADCGKPITPALGEVDHAADVIAFYAEAVDKLYDEIAPTADSALALVTREPIGVVAAVVPWNFPLGMPAWKIGPALATGNSLIVKPAEQSSLVMLALGELAAAAGVPDGVLGVVPGLGEAAGAALGRHMGVDAVAFTGSTEVGKLFLRYAGESNMKQVSLECGGKSPNVVLADAPDLDVAAAESALAAFVNQGEMCSAGSRLIVEEPIADALLDRLVDATAAWRPGNPFDPQTRMGAIVDGVQLSRILGYIESGIEQGAQLTVGGHQAFIDSGGFYVEPTIFDGVDNGMRIAREEIFGPVLSVIRARNADDAVRIANDTRYGLAAAIWTRDVSRVHRISRRLRAGSVWVNCYNRSDVNVPFGGFKQSGFGRDKSLHALDKYTQLKTTWIDLGA